MSWAGRHLGQAWADAELLHQGVCECGQTTVLGYVGTRNSHLAGWRLHGITALTEGSVNTQASPESPPTLGRTPRGGLAKSMSLYICIINIYASQCFSGPPHYCGILGIQSALLRAHST